MLHNIKKVKKKEREKIKENAVIERGVFLDEIIPQIVFSKF